MTEVTIKFKDRSRSDLKLKTDCDYINHCYGIVMIPLLTNGKVKVEKGFSADSIEELTVVTRTESEDS